MPGNNLISCALINLIIISFFLVTSYAYSNDLLVFSEMFSSCDQIRFFIFNEKLNGTESGKSGLCWCVLYWFSLCSFLKHSVLFLFASFSGVSVFPVVQFFILFYSAFFCFCVFWTENGWLLIKKYSFNSEAILMPFMLLIDIFSFIGVY